MISDFSPLADCCQLPFFSGLGQTRTFGSWCGPGPLRKADDGLREASDLQRLAPGLWPFDRERGVQSLRQRVAATCRDAMAPPYPPWTKPQPQPLPLRRPLLMPVREMRVSSKVGASAVTRSLSRCFASRVADEHGTCDDVSSILSALSSRFSRISGMGLPISGTLVSQRGRRRAARSSCGLWCEGIARVVRPGAIEGGSGRIGFQYVVDLPQLTCGRLALEAQCHGQQPKC